MLTLSQLQTICGARQNLEAFVDPLNKTFAKFNITSPERAEAFLAEVVIESGYFSRLSENLNYSAAELLKVFPTHFRPASAAQWEHNPEAIANIVYANRMGNGDQASGDGWTYRGRGLIQITGKYLYKLLAADLGMSLEDTVNYLETPEGATVSAGWFWNHNDLNRLADARDIKTISVKINGGTNDLADREAVYEKAETVFG
jgi:putative chitinase